EFGCLRRIGFRDCGRLLVLRGLRDIAALTNKPEGSAAALGADKRSAPAAPGIAPQRQLAETMAAIAPSPAPPAEGRVQI
ncbi:hypothetical protein ACC853_38305, partial [Rhizobium johnstonii]